MLAEMNKKIPLWILIVSGIFALMELMVSTMIYLSPEEIVENLDLQASGVSYLVSMWATRQFALGVIFTIATLKKSRSMLTLAYSFLLVMFIGDLFVGTIENESGLIYPGIAMVLVSGTILFFVNKK